MPGVIVINHSALSRSTHFPVRIDGEARGGAWSDGSGTFAVESGCHRVQVRNGPFRSKTVTVNVAEGGRCALTVKVSISACLLMMTIMLGVPPVISRHISYGASSAVFGTEAVGVIVLTAMLIAVPALIPGFLIQLQSSARPGRCTGKAV